MKTALKFVNIDEVTVKNYVVSVFMAHGVVIPAVYATA